MHSSMPKSRLTTIGAFLTITSSAARAADVLVVDIAGGGAYTSIRSAVAASQDGDIVLVRAGNYAEEVEIDRRTVTLVGEGMPRLVGHLVIENLDSTDAVHVAGLVIEPPIGVFPYNPFIGALDVRNSLGAVRVQDCRLLGADREGRSPYWTWCTSGGCVSPDGGCGVLAVACEDIALVDCVVEGGEGSVSAVAVSGYGGDGVVADRVTHMSIVRTVVRGGPGGIGDDPGNGGAGVRLVGHTSLQVAYAAFFGGIAGCWAGWVGTPYWTDFGGDGLVRGAGTITYDFEGLYFAGEAAPMPCVPQFWGVSSHPGAPQSGSGGIVGLDGFPNTLHAPTLVREGQPWSLEIVAPAGEAAHVLYASATTFRFRPALEQPRLVGVPSHSLIGPPALVPATQRLILGQAPFQLPAAAMGDIVWLQAVVGPVGGVPTLSSARFVVRLDASL